MKWQMKNSLQTSTQKCYTKLFSVYKLLELLVKKLEIAAAAPRKQASQLSPNMAMSATAIYAHQAPEKSQRASHMTSLGHSNKIASFADPPM